MSISQIRPQQTIQQTAKVSGFGLFDGVDVTLEFCPASVDFGIVFERVDLASPIQIPALIENVIPRSRCTVISANGSSVAVIEHVMAALAGLNIDNCLVRINAPEPPIGDGSSQHFIEALLTARVCTQDKLRDSFSVTNTVVTTENEHVGVAVQPAREAEYEIGFFLNYPKPVIGKQCFRSQITPDIFTSAISHCRTFILEQEVTAIQAAGIGLRATPQNVLVFTDTGPVENELRETNECVRHKVLDCVGDFALLGVDVQGRFTATQSGHRHNHDIIRMLRTQYLSLKSITSPSIRAAG